MTQVSYLIPFAALHYPKLMARYQKKKSLPLLLLETNFFVHTQSPNPNGCKIIIQTYTRS